MRYRIEQVVRQHHGNWDLENVLVREDDDGATTELAYTFSWCLSRVLPELNRLATIINDLRGHKDTS